jgi:hypothetical protein
MDHEIHVTAVLTIIIYVRSSFEQLSFSRVMHGSMVLCDLCLVVG